MKLFKKSVLKQQKYREIIALLGNTEGMRLLDIGSDNGVISYLLRGRGGSWKSADLEEQTVAAIQSLVGSGVYRIDGGQTPFSDQEFDGVVVIDFLEHIQEDARFIEEIDRILKPGGVLILNVPHRKDSLLRRVRLRLGQTDEQHGHLRPGYTLDELQNMLGSRFTIERSRTYSKFFSELVNTLIIEAVNRKARRKPAASRKGLVVTGSDLTANQNLFRLYSLAYPLVWLVAQLDQLLFFRSGYSLILRASTHKLGEAE